jgi:hypothetical protein
VQLVGYCGLLVASDQLFLTEILVDRPNVSVYKDDQVIGRYDLCQFWYQLVHQNRVQFVTQLIESVVICLQERPAHPMAHGVEHRQRDAVITAVYVAKADHQCTHHPMLRLAAAKHKETEDFALVSL